MTKIAQKVLKVVFFISPPEENSLRSFFPEKYVCFKNST